MCYNLAENVKLYFLHICVNIWNELYLIYMFWMDFHFCFRNFLEDLFFFKSLCMLALLCSAPIFQHYKHYFAPHLKYNVFLLSDWKNNSLLLYSYNFNPIKNIHLRHVTVHYFSRCVHREPYFFGIWCQIRLFFVLYIM
jgi:hypothetical protein